MKPKSIEVPVVMPLIDSSVLQVREELEDGELRPEEVLTFQGSQDMQITFKEPEELHQSQENQPQDFVQVMEEMQTSSGKVITH